MKERLLVMNGQKILQNEVSGKWENAKVDKAPSTLKPAIYNIYSATLPDKAKAYSGIVVHVDKENVYQQVGKVFVKHKLADFENAPIIGETKSISYDSTSRAVVAKTIKLARGLSR